MTTANNYKKNNTRTNKKTGIINWEKQKWEEKNTQAF